MHAYPLLGQLGGGWALEISIFWAPNGTRLSARYHITGPKKLMISMAQPLPLALVMDAACIKSITHGPYKS
jgi:hypothetical protein